MPAPPHPSSDKEGSGITARKHLQPFEVLILIFVLDLQVDGRFPHRKDYTTLLSTMFVLRPLSYILLGAMLAWASPGLIPGSPRSVNKGGIRDRDFFNAELANNATMETRGLGINCRGSIGCSVACPPIWMMIWLFDAWVGDDQHYDNGKWIGCINSICAFLQNTDGANGQQIKMLTRDIINHGCEVCGSVRFIID